jgi:hypothetical protein
MSGGSMANKQQADTQAAQSFHVHSVDPGFCGYKLV